MTWLIVTAYQCHKYIMGESRLYQVVIYFLKLLVRKAMDINVHQTLSNVSICMIFFQLQYEFMHYITYMSFRYYIMQKLNLVVLLYNGVAAAATIAWAWGYGVKATFNNTSAISWRSVLLVEETGVPEENRRPVA